MKRFNATYNCIIVVRAWVILWLWDYKVPLAPRYFWVLRVVMPSKVGCQYTHSAVISFLYRYMLLLHRAITLLEIQWVLTALRYWLFFIFLLQKKLFFSLYTAKNSCPQSFFSILFISSVNSRNTLCTVVNLHSHMKNRFKANRGFDLHKTFTSTTKRVFHCVNLSLGKQMPLDATRASWTQNETQASCFNCKRQSGRVIRLRFPRSRWWATSEVKRIFSKMRFFPLSLSLSLSLSSHAPFCRSRERDATDGLCTNASVVLHSSSAFSSQRIMAPLKASRPFTLEPLEIRRYSTSHASRPDAVHLLYRAVCTFE